VPAGVAAVCQLGGLHCMAGAGLMVPAIVAWQVMRRGRTADCQRGRSAFAFALGSRVCDAATLKHVSVCQPASGALARWQLPAAHAPVLQAFGAGACAAESRGRVITGVATGNLRCAACIMTGPLCRAAMVASRRAGADKWEWARV